MTATGTGRGGRRTPGPGKTLGRPLGSGKGRRKPARQITAPPELWARIEAAAAAEHLDVSAWMRLAAEQLLRAAE